MFYSDFFVKKMEREERLQFQLYVKVTEQTLVMYDDDRYTGLIDLIRTNNKLPVIMTNEKGEFLASEGLDTTKTYYDIEIKKGVTYDPGYFQ